MEDPASENARAADARLVPEFGQRIVIDVEAALRDNEGVQQPDQYFVDPISLEG
jgi:hypothetical protein